MAGERPRLEVVSEGSEEQPAAETAPAAEREGGSRIGWTSWVLLALLVLALLAFGFQTRRAGSLAGEVAELNGQVGQLVMELAETQTALEAHQGHLDEVRAAVETLQELVNTEPAAPGESP